jgi:hypothetical protein
MAPAPATAAFRTTAPAASAVVCLAPLPSKTTKKTA